MAHTLHGLLTGSNRYRPTVPPFGGGVNDIEAVTASLGGFAGGEQFRPEFNLLRDAEATRAGVIDGFRRHLFRAGPDDILLFYFGSQETQEDASMLPPRLASSRPSAWRSQRPQGSPWSRQSGSSSPIATASSERAIMSSPGPNCTTGSHSGVRCEPKATTPGWTRQLDAAATRIPKRPGRSGRREAGGASRLREAKRRGVPDRPCGNGAAARTGRQSTGPPRLGEHRHDPRTRRRTASGR